MAGAIQSLLKTGAAFKRSLKIGRTNHKCTKLTQRNGWIHYNIVAADANVCNDTRTTPHFIKNSIE
jgi:hypothetical protein